MNWTKVLGVVLVVHLLVGSFLLILPGCKSTPRSSSSGEATRVSGDIEPPGFYESNPSGITTTTNRSSPRRPDSGSWPAYGSTNTRGSDLEDFNTIPPSSDIIAPAPTTTTRTPSPGTASASTYEVEKGDSLWVIAKRNNVSLDALLAANNLTKNSVIRPGQQLVIPGASTSSSSSTPRGSSQINPELNPASSGGGTSYKVVSGDTLSGIARRYGTTVEAIRVANGLTSNNIQVNQVLDIPDGGSSAAERARSSSSTSGSSTPVAGPGEDIHVVRPGENPGGIARRYGMTTAELMELNGITDPRKLRAGQPLVVKVSSSTAATSRSSTSATSTRSSSSSSSSKASTPTTSSSSTTTRSNPNTGFTTPASEAPLIVPPSGGSDEEAPLLPSNGSDEDLSDIPVLGEEMP